MSLLYRQSKCNFQKKKSNLGIRSKYCKNVKSLASAIYLHAITCNEEVATNEVTYHKFMLTRKNGMVNVIVVGNFQELSKLNKSFDKALEYNLLYN